MTSCTSAPAPRRRSSFARSKLDNFFQVRQSAQVSFQKPHICEAGQVREFGQYRNIAKSKTLVSYTAQKNDFQQHNSQPNVCSMKKSNIHADCFCRTSPSQYVTFWGRLMPVFKLVALALLFCSAPNQTAKAATIVWNGPATTNTANNWSSGGNWVGGSNPATTDDAKFFDLGAVPGTVPNITNFNNTVDVTTNIASLQYGNTNNFHTTLISSGTTLSITGNGGLTAGTLTDNGSAQVVYATITGFNGVLNVSNIAANVLADQGRAANGNGTQRAILDLSGLGTFVATINRVAVGTTTLGGANNAQNATGTLKLAQTNVISPMFAGTPIANNVAVPTNSIDIGSDNGNAGGA